MKDLFARVYVLDAPFFIDRKFDYLIPNGLAEKIETGSIISVPFGKGNKSSYALVAEITDTTDFAGVKSVIDVISDVSLNEELMKLCMFLKDRTRRRRKDGGPRICFR